MPPPPPSAPLHRPPRAAAPQVSSWLFFALAMGVLVAVGAMVVRQQERTAEGLLAEVREALARPTFDERRQLGRLEAALALATADGDDALCTAVLLTRARLYRDLEAVGKAREDYRTILERFAPADRDIRFELIELQRDTGNLAAGIELARGLLVAEPGRARTVTMLGTLLRRSAEERVESVQAELRRMFVADEAEPLQALCRRIANLVVDDPVRVALLLRLREVFRPEEETRVAELLQELDRASEENAQALQAFAVGVDFGVDPAGIATIVELLLEAGHVEPAIQVGLVALRTPEVAPDPRTRGLVVRALNERGRHLAAAHIASPAFTPELVESLDAAFLVQACTAFEAAESPHQLAGAALRLYLTGSAAADVAQAAAGQAWLTIAVAALARQGQKEWTEVLINAERFLVGDAADPFPNARARLLAIVAEAGAALPEMAYRERDALASALAANPDMEGAGEAWLRLAELQLEMRYGGYEVPLASVTHAIEHLPGRATELLPRWRELGEQAASAKGFALELRIRNLRAQGDWVPSVGATSYELFAMGELYLADGEPVGAATAAKRVLREHPRFLPAIDLLADAYAALENTAGYREQALRRLELAGPDARTKRLFAALDPDDLSSSEVLRRMRADPRGFARTRFLEELARRDRGDLALAALAEIGAAELDADQRLVAADLLVEAGREEQVGGLLEAVGERADAPASATAGEGAETSAVADATEGGGRAATGPAGSSGPAEPSGSSEPSGSAGSTGSAGPTGFAGPAPRSGPAPRPDRAPLAEGERRQSLGLQLEAALRSDDAAALGRAARAIAAQEMLEPDWTLRQVDRLLEHGHVTPALHLLDRLDARAETRGGGVLRRLAVGRAMAGDLEGARRAAARAEAFLDEGEPLAARLFVALDEGRLDRARESAARLAALSRPSTVGAAALELLAGRLEPARGRIDAALADPDHDDRLGLLALVAARLAGEEPAIPAAFGDGAAETETLLAGEPRIVLGWIAAQELEAWRPWAALRLAGADPDRHGRLWPAFLHARSLVLRGERGAALDRLHALNRYFPTFAPAWRLRVTLFADGRDPRDPELVALRALRRDTLGEHAAPPRELWLERSWHHELHGELEAAVHCAREAIGQAEDPAPEARRQLARALLASGDARGALAVWHELVELARPAFVSRVLPEVLEALAAARDARPPVLAPEEVEAELAELAQVVPADPLIALALARHQLHADPNNPSLGVSKAFARLEEFRSQTDDVALEHLRPGSTESWLELYLSLDPARAERFVARELQLFPGAIELWVARARVLEGRERWREAIEELELLREVLPTPDVLRHLAELYARSGRSHREVRDALALMHRLEDTDPRNPRSFLLAARSLVAAGGSGIQEALASYLEPLWSRRQVASQSIDLAELARLYAFALLLRNQENDAKTARLVLERSVRLADTAYTEAATMALFGLAR